MTWHGTPKTKRELREGFFAQKFDSKLLKTLMNIDPNAIFLKNGLKTQMGTAFRGNSRADSTEEVNRVCYPNYTLNSPKLSNFLCFRGVCKCFVNCLNRGFSRMTRISRIFLFTAEGVV